MNTSELNGDSYPGVQVELGKELGGIKIPPRPAILSHVEAEMRSKAPNLGTLESIISLDVGISASLLKMANSAYFGHQGHVRSVKEALQILGLKTIASALAALSLRKAFAHVPNLERFWDSSARIAQLSGWLVTQLSLPAIKLKQEEVFTFGLFRDCGIPALASMLDDYFDVLKRVNEESQKPFTDAEVSELGIETHHAMIGGILGQEWQLPIEFNMAIKRHHDVDVIWGRSPHLVPEMSRYFIALAQLAEHLHQELTGLNKTCEWSKLGEACRAVLGINEQEVDMLVQKAHENRIHVEPVI